MKVEIVKCDITDLDVEAIVNPSNSTGSMGGGVALTIKKRGGIDIEDEAVRKSPVKIGDAIITTAGKLKANYVIHTPTMKKPMKTNAENIRKATLAALRKAYEKNIRSVAFPLMGAGIGGLSPRTSATTMLNVIQHFLKEHPKAFKRIVVVAYSREDFEDLLSVANDFNVIVNCDLKAVLSKVK